MTLVPKRVHALDVNDDGREIQLVRVPAGAAASLSRAALFATQSSGGLGSRLIGVIGPSGGEGARTVGVGIAQSVAMPGVRKILLFDMNAAAGQWSAQRWLGGNVELGDCIQLREDGFYDLGGADESGGFLGYIDRAGMVRLFDAIRESFDFCVVVLPPALVSTGGLIAASCLDSTILVVEADRTTFEEATSARDSLTQVRARIAGVIINKSHS